LNQRLDLTDSKTKLEKILKLINKKDKKKFKKFVQYYDGFNFNNNFSGKNSNKLPFNFFFSPNFPK